MTKPSEQSENTYSLLVWEEIPENTTFVLIPNNVANIYRNHLEQAHNKFINSDDENDGMRFLNAALMDNPEDAWDDYSKTHASVLAQYKRADRGGSPIVNVYITHVYLSGFVL